MSVSTADLPIGPITSDHARRASWLADLHTALGAVATRTELAEALSAAQKVLDSHRGAPCTAPADDQERRVREIVRVRSAIITAFLEELGAVVDREREAVLV